ncbi:MAG: barstar family protein [Pirellulaceae bacterium]
MQVFETTAEVHETLADALRFPAYYGKNLDALWDCATCDVDRPTHLTWRNFAATQKNLGPKVDAIRQVLEEAAEENSNLVVRVED